MKAYCFSDRGLKREKNEDNLGFVCRDQIILTSSGDEFSKEINFDGWFGAILCDGMGGYKGGEIASSFVCKNFIDILEELLSKKAISEEYLEKTVQEIFKDTDSKLLEMGKDNPELEDLGTTIAGLIYTEELGLYAFHAGDTRVYHLYGGYLQEPPLTIDHNEFEEALKERIVLPAGAGNSLTNCLGAGLDINYLEFRKIQKPLDNRNHYFLCTDGLYKYVHIGELESALELDNLTETVQKISTSVKIQNASDNFSGIFIKV